MTIEQIIQKAQEGEYMPEYYMKLTPGGFIHITAKDDEIPSMPDKSLPDILIDPNFWTALGKVMGWGWLCRSCGKKIVSDDGGCENYDCEGSDDAEYEEWLSWWHRLIDHLSEGKGIQSFFNQF